jgi:nucleotide-binding universal stress UspA family protein
MSCLVAFDGSQPSSAALERAAAFADETERLLVVSVVPTDERLAAAYGLAETGTEEAYDPERTAERLRAAATRLAAAAGFRVEYVDGYAGKRTIAATIREVAGETAADTVVVGCEAAGRVVEALCGGDTAAQPTYDVLVVRSSPDG